MDYPSNGPADMNRKDRDEIDSIVKQVRADIGYQITSENIKVLSHVLVKKETVPNLNCTQSYDENDWIFERKFASPKMANVYMEKWKEWRRKSGKIQKKSIRRQYYQCNLVPSKGPQCPAGKFLLYDDNNRDVLLFGNQAEHKHDTVTVLPNKNKDYDLDTPYTVNYSHDCAALFISTKKLFKNTIISRVLHIDHSAIIVCGNFKIVPVGTTDLSNNFHPFGLCMFMYGQACDYDVIFHSIKKGLKAWYQYDYVPEYLVASHDQNIIDSFRLAFGSSPKIITCSTFVKNEIFAQLNVHNFYTNKSRRQCTQDIVRIQTLCSADVFNQAMELFNAKWQHEEDLMISLRETCFKSFTNWYEGYADFIPSNNDALVRVAKSLQANVDKMKPKFKVLKNFVKKTIQSWSNSYGTGEMKFAQTPKIDDHMEDACAWLKQTKHIDIERNGDETWYYVKRGGKNGKYTDAFKQKVYNDLDELLENEMDTFVIKKNHESVITCSCYRFLRSFTCAHSIGVAFLLDLVEIPSTMIPDCMSIPYYLKLD